MPPADKPARSTGDPAEARGDAVSASAAPANDERARRPGLGPAFFLALIDGMARRGKRSRSPGPGAIG